MLSADFFYKISLIICKSSHVEVIRINYKKPDPQVFKKAAQIIKSGGLVIVPSDTVYAIFGNSLNQKTLEKVFRLKRRNPVKRFLLGLYPLERIYKYVEYNPLIPKILKRFPNLPISFGLPRKKTLPPFLNSGFELVAFRFFFNQLDKELFKHIDMPLIGTSANISGQPNIFSAREVIERFRPTVGTPEEPELILDGGEFKNTSPSIIIELPRRGTKVIRGGDIGINKLQRELDKIAKDNH